MSDAENARLQPSRPVNGKAFQHLRIIVTAIAIFLFAVPFCQAQQKTTATRDISPDQRQFERAVALRTRLESLPPDQRSLDQYNHVISAYKRVPAIKPKGDLVTASIVATAELYADMGRIFDEKYLDTAIEGYNQVLTDFPNSRYAAACLLAIGNIQEQDLKQLDNAEATYKNVAKKFPRSVKANDAIQDIDRINRTRKAQQEVQRETAKELADRQAAAAKSDSRQDAVREKDQRQSSIDAANRAEAQASAGATSAEKRNAKAYHTTETGPINPSEGGKSGGIARVTGVHPWNGENYTRIIVDLGDTVRFTAGRLKNPNRLFFDIEEAKLDPGLGTKTIEVQTSIVKTIRFAQNKADVVRLVLDMDTDKDYSAFVIPNPYRLVIDVHGQPQNTRNAVVRQGPDLPQPKARLSDDQPAAKSGTAGTAANNASSADGDSGNDNSSSPTAEGTVGTGKPATRSSEPSERLPMHQTAPNKGVRTLVPAPEPKPTRDGQTSLTRALGLKISRIVIDPGHGGHDTGTIGPHGLMEKDLCLDIALRLGKLIQDKLPGAEVVYTRKDDTFIPLEERTAIANQVKADLFISIHANSSHDAQARGVETYYLNFATSQEAMDVAARENALSQSGLHDLQDIIKKIARNDKIEESKELAGDIQDSLSRRLQQINHTEKDRGVKKAPFVVLIGADMPSVLSEISFISNPADEKLLKKGDQRQRVADGIYRGVSSYLQNMNSLSYNQQKPLLGPRTQLAAAGNPK
jgi:N-acetylmuramoyl-L-alanine amidase